MVGPIPRATVTRLPLYLHCLEGMSQDIVSSDQLAEIAGVSSAKVRKDLSYLSPQGTRGVGYEVAELKRLIASRLGRSEEYAKVAIVGAGNLGQALAGFDGFTESGFQVGALFDSDPAKVGTQIAGLHVHHVDDMGVVVKEEDVVIGMIATPDDAAQQVADALAEAGVRSIVNFAPAVLKVPAGVEVRRVDLSTELQILSYYLNVELD